MFRILVADDEGIMLESIKSIILSNFGSECQVACVKTGRAVIEQAEAFRPDIAIVDIQMPGLSGIQAIREVRRFNSSMVFIIITAYDKFSYAQEAVNLGVMEFITKPVNKKKILDVCIRAMHQVEEARKKLSDDLKIREKLELVKASGAFAVAMDIDAAGLPFLQNLNPPAGSKSVEELKEIVKMAEVPFILKGIMTANAARKAREAGAQGIIVSNHGGRVQDQCPATAEVLAEIVDAVGADMTILVDGGIRSGVDLYKALALGADGVLVARPYVTAVYGGQKDGVTALTEKLLGELRDTMKMCGTYTLEEIGRENIRQPHLG